MVSALRLDFSQKTLLDGEGSSVVSKSVSLLICDFSYHRDLRRFMTGILSTRSVQTCSLINTTKCFLIWTVASLLAIAMLLTLSLHWL